MEAADFEAKMAAMRMAFRARAADDAAELEILVQGSPSSENLKRVQHLAHRLVGGAATFGLPDLTAPALLLETEVIDGGPSIGPFATSLIAAIRKCIDQTGSGEV